MQSVNRKERGFSLIELVIVMAIAGILATIAIPSYREYVVRSYRSDAQEFMLEVATSAQAYRLSNRIYPTALGENLGELDITADANLARHYEFSLAADNSASPPSFTFTATPRAGSMMEADDEMVYYSDGRRTPVSLWK